MAALLFGGPLLRPCVGQVTLAWSPSLSPAVAGYYLCYGTSSGVYTATNSFPSGQSSGVISNLIPNQVYYFAVQSFANNGAVSSFSNEASFTNAPAAALAATLTPLSITWAVPAPIVYGTPLGASQLNAAANLPGSFAYFPGNGAVLNAGQSTVSVVFTPSDTADYSTVTNTTTLAVLPAPLAVTVANTSCVYGTADPIFTGAMSGLTNGDSITVTYSCGATCMSPVGTYVIAPIFADPSNELPNYTLSVTNGFLTILPATPSVTWTNPPSMVYGTPLNSNQLNATANLPGTFSYFPTNGTVLNTGTNALSVVFTPADMLDYLAVTNSISLVVAPAPLTVTATSLSCLFGQAVPVLTGTATGLTNGDGITATYSCGATNGSPSGIYAIVPSLVDPDNRQTNYNVTLNNGTLTVGQSSPTITWTNPASITYGTPLSSNQLSAAANVPGSFTFVPTNGAVLNTGTNALTVTFTPADTTDFSSVTASVDLFVSTAPLLVTAADANRPYGVANPLFLGSMAGLTNGDNITATYSCGASNGSPAGTYAIAPSLVDPNNRQTNYSVILVNGTLTVGQSTATMVWTNPTSVVYGTALSSNQLNATANVPGNFIYDPTNGALLNSGTNTLSVTFTPADTADYRSVSASVNLLVTPAPLTITASNASRPYGAANPLFLGSMTGLTNGDKMTATYSCGATNGSPAGTYAILPGLVDSGNRQTNYSVTLANGTLTVSPSTATLSWTNPAPIFYGTALSSNQLNATALVPGSFVYDPTNGAVLNSGTNTLSVSFTPADSVDYSSVTATVNLFVSAAPLTVTVANANRPYGVGNPLFLGAITGVTNHDEIRAAYTCGATNRSPAGTYAIVPGLIDPDNRQTNYDVTLVHGTLTVAPANPILTWTNPAPIIYGTALGSRQLNATANVPGAFSYWPGNGAVLNAGTNALSVIFTPADALDYYGMSNTVSLAVLPAPLTVLSSNASRVYGAGNPSFAGAIIGLTNGDRITETFRCRATLASPVGVYSIIPLLDDPQGRLNNYHVGVSAGTLMVLAAPINESPIPVTSAGLLPTGAGILGSSPVINSSANFWGVPPSMIMTVSNGTPSVTIAGTLGATLVIQSNSDLEALDNWRTATSVVMSHPAPVKQSQAAVSARNILSQAFVQASQSVLLPPNDAGPNQFFRVIMPYDYAILGSMVLKGKGYTPRLIVVNMPGILCDDACYVNEANSFIHYDWPRSALQLEASGATIRQIAETLAESLQLSWTSASEFTFSNGLCQIWATVVQTEPPSSDPIAGQNPPSEPMAIDY